MVKTLPTLTRTIGARMLARQPETEPPVAPTEPGIAPAHGSTAIRIWLLVVAALVLLTLSVGGMTRLTNSGLSITEWEPIMGIIPPLSAAEWQEQFDKYKATYEYRYVNMNMTLDEFRYIFNWEWRHRVLARLIFLAMFLPFIVFLLAGRLSKAMQTKVFVVLGLIVFQGFVGWIMVQSGLRSDVRVSSYRLALHLGLASLLFAMLIAMALGQDQRPLPPARSLTLSRRWGRVCIGLLFGLILLGALVAGLRGGRTHDTWPLMEGQLVPGNLFALSPWIVNVFENPLTVQWVHRLLAYIVVGTAIVHWRATIRRVEPDVVQRGAQWLAIGMCLQMLLGIVTVLNQVPIPLGLAHQLGAFMLLTLAIWHLYEIERHIAGTQTVTTWTQTSSQSATTPPPSPPSNPQTAGSATPGQFSIPTTTPVPTTDRTAVTAPAPYLPTPPAPPVSGVGNSPPIVRPVPQPGKSPFPTIGGASGATDRTPGPVPPPYRRPSFDS